MSILCDWEIKALSLGDQLIEPFVDHVVREENKHIFDSPIQCKTIRGSFICIKQEEMDITDGNG